MLEKLTYEELERRTKELEKENSEFKRSRDALEKRFLSLTQPSKDDGDIVFEDLFNIDDIQCIQDEFAEATGVASIITHIDGTPITAPSNFCRLCKGIIRKTDKGLLNCFKSDAAIGRFNPEGPTIQPCLSGGLWDAGVGITVAGRHIANWLIGQVRDELQSEDKMAAYARKIGADEKIVVEAFRQVPAMSREQFGHIANLLFTLANQMSTTAYQSVQQARLINETQQAQKTLQESEFVFSQMFEQSTTSMCLYNPQGKIVKANREFCKMFGVEEKAIINSGYNIFKDQAAIDAGIIPSVRDIFDRKKTRKWKIEYDVDSASKSTKTPTSKSGKICIEAFGYPVLNHKGNLEYVVFQHHNITKHKLTEEALAASENEYKSTLDNLLIGVVVHAADTSIIISNPEASNILGLTYEQMSGKKSIDPTWSFVHEDLTIMNVEDYPISKVLSTKKPLYDCVFGINRPDREYLTWVLVNAIPIFSNKNELEKVIVNFIDITDSKQAQLEKEKLESQLRQAAKIEAVGTLAGGIAHDFNNILGIIIGNTELAIDDVPDWNPASQNLKEIKTASFRARDVVRQLLSFSRKSEQEKRLIKIQGIIIESIHLLRASLPSSVKFISNIPADLKTIMADPTQIHQVIINLCTNAAHAMEKNGGTLEISLDEIELDEVFSSKYLNVKSGHYIQLTVSDTGCGIDPAIKDRIFDPYFTTKETDKGTGIGLSVVHGIVKNHDGAISVYSEPDKGTTVKIIFPVFDGRPVQEDRNSKRLLKGNENVLFVDDEKALIKIGKKILESLGYNVEASTAPVEALEQFRSDPSMFDLVITDMTMPQMTGDKFVTELLKIRPDIPIILCTGFSEKISRESAGELGIRKYLEKPLNKRELSITIREILDEKNR